MTYTWHIRQRTFLALENFFFDPKHLTTKLHLSIQFLSRFYFRKGIWMVAGVSQALYVKDYTFKNVHTYILIYRIKGCMYSIMSIQLLSIYGYCATFLWASQTSTSIKKFSVVVYVKHTVFYIYNHLWKWL